nr:FecR domain-containing protein [Rhodopseudomonas rhenobacensis]
MSTTGRIAGAAALLALIGGAATAQEVGKASAVNPAATANLRTITIGASISHKERIKTAAEGSVQLLFIDKTSMTIGPNSDLTIDEYVYNPNAGTGKLAATLGKGALRFVGGQISHSGDAEIKTADAVIGIRGGVALISTANVYAGYGSSTVTSRGGSVTLGAGEFTALSGGGAPPSPPGPPPEGFVARMIQSFQSAGGQSGGAPKGTASPANVARAESRATGRNGGAVAGSLTPTPVVTHVAPLLAGSTTTTSLAQTIQTSTQSGVVQNVAKDMRPSITLTGWIGGIDRVEFDYGTMPFVGNGIATVKLDGTAGRMQADFLFFEEGHLQFGSIDPAMPADSVYQDYNNFTATSPRGKTSNGVPYVGTVTTVSTSQARAFATSVGTPNLTICECEYTKWGIWEVHTPDNYVGSPERLTGSWVAGRSPGINDVPTTGRATYTGHVIANVQDVTLFRQVVGDQRLVAGNFSNTVDFGNRTGSVSVSNLDRTNYTGVIALQSDPRNFVGALRGDVGDRSMGLLGSFFRGPKNPVGEMGGTVVIGGTNYLGSGVFAARTR